MQDLNGQPDCPLCGAAVACPLSPTAGSSVRGARRAAEDEAAYRAETDAERFAHFDLLSSVGKGGAGWVYRARNRRTDRMVAVKVCQFSPVESQVESWKRALREVEAAALDHPHIVTVYDAGLARGRPYVEMEYVPGGSVREETGYSVDGARRICREVLSALASAHEAGVVHRDLKPSNVLLDAEGRAKVGDFGLCKLLDRTGSTTTGKILGSPHFMAPEQWTGGQIGPYTDVYAAGLLFYFLLTGLLPFDAEDPLSVMYKHLHFELPDPREEGHNVSGDLVCFLRRATARKPADRFEDAEECLQALSEL
ncbi:MAG: serine/threonine-protein kinase [Planctomycetota bacterium]